MDYEVACNWKVYVDNYLEGYHIPLVHPGLFRELDYKAYPGDLQANLVVPLGPERTLTRFEWLAAASGPPGFEQQLEPALALSEQVQREDVAICEAVQQGLRSATYHSGRYSVRHENGVHHFHGLLSRFLAD